MSELTVVDVWAEWCAPCKKFSPIFERVSKNHPDTEFVKVNADENFDFLNKFDIRGIPTILILRDNEVIFSHAGIVSEANLENLVSTYEKVNMSKGSI